MKNIYSILAISFLSLLLNFGTASDTKACDRTDVKLDSITYTGGQYNIFVTLNIGAGVRAANVGAGGNTRTFAVNFFGKAGFSVTSFTPSIRSHVTRALYTGANLGPFMGSRMAIGYLDTGTDFTCIWSETFCGVPHTEAHRLMFRMPALPDSLRILGVEGGGNPVAGCYPNPDMMLIFTAFPVVWTSFDGNSDARGAHLNWTTAQETNNDHFKVLRSSNGTEFEAIGEVTAVGNSQEESSYEFHDANPFPGINYYKIVQVDDNGQQGSSQIVSLVYEVPSEFALTGVSPVPADDNLNINFTSPVNQEIRIQLSDLSGRTISSQSFTAVAGNNQAELDLSQFPAGIYMVNLTGTQGSLVKKIVKG